MLPLSSSCQEVSWEQSKNVLEFGSFKKVHLHMSILQANHISKHFGALMAVNDISFSIEKGEILGMIGPNGAGKTTLFNCIMGLTRPTKGQVLFASHDITGFAPHKVCRLGLTKTSQITEPFRSMTVFENCTCWSAFRG